MWIPITSGMIIGVFIICLSLEIIEDWLKRKDPVDYYEVRRKQRESEEFDRLYGPH